MEVYRQKSLVSERQTNEQDTRADARIRGHAIRGARRKDIVWISRVCVCFSRFAVSRMKPTRSLNWGMKLALSTIVQFWVRHCPRLSTWANTEGAYHLSELLAGLHQPVRKWKGSVLAKQELFLAILDLLWKDDYGHKKLSQFARTDAFHLQSSWSARLTSFDKW